MRKMRSKSLRKASGKRPPRVKQRPNGTLAVYGPGEDKPFMLALPGGLAHAILGGVRPKRVRG